jgi:peptide/nickel transport system permease protein
MGVPALILGMAGGVLLGSLHAACRNRRTGRLLDFVSSIALSLPSLVLGLAALLLASRTQWFPLGSMSSLAGQELSALGWLADRARHLVLPVACLTVPILASVERIQWGAAREAFDELFIRSARARGIGGLRIFLHYIVRPSLNPVLSTSGPILGTVLSGSLVLEIIFAWPGLGQITYNALFSRDLFLLVGCVVASATLLIAGNIAADLALIALDPRTRRSFRGGSL